MRAHMGECSTCVHTHTTHANRRKVAFCFLLEMQVWVGELVLAIQAWGIGCWSPAPMWRARCDNHVCSPNAAHWTQEDPRHLLISQPSQLASSRFSERPCLQNYGGEWFMEIPSCTHAHTVYTLKGKCGAGCSSVVEHMLGMYETQVL